MNFNPLLQLRKHTLQTDALYYKVLEAIALILQSKPLKQKINDGSAAQRQN